MQPICATFGMQGALQPPDAERCIRPHAVSTHRAEATSCILFPGGGGKRSPGSHRASEFLWHESALRDRRGRDQQVVGASELAQTLTPREERAAAGAQPGALSPPSRLKGDREMSRCQAPLRERRSSTSPRAAPRHLPRSRGTSQGNRKTAYRALMQGGSHSGLLLCKAGLGKGAWGRLTSRVHQEHIPMTLQARGPWQIYKEKCGKMHVYVTDLSSSKDGEITL